MSTYNFHFLITDELKDELNNIKELSDYSFSGKINFILKKSNNIIRHLNKLKINDKSRIETLSSKKNIHLYIKEKIYKKVKYYHGKFNYFSLAKFIRMCIRIFIEMVKKNGFKNALKKIKNVQNKLKKILIVQLLDFLKVKHNQNLKLEKILMKLLF